MARSNLFANMENQFEFCDAEEITGKTLQGFVGLIEELEERQRNKGLFVILIAGAKLGVATNTGKLNDKEKALVDATFGQIWTGDIEDVYIMLSGDINDNDFEIVQMITQMGNNIALPFLHLVLGFAYIDKKVNDQVMEKLDRMFGNNLLVLFLQSGLEEVPAPEVKIVGLEAEIVKWFQSDDQLRPLNDIVAHFPGKSKSEIKKALNGLCDKGILYGGDQIVGCMYGLADGNSSDEYDDDEYEDDEYEDDEYEDDEYEDDEYEEDDYEEDEYEKITEDELPIVIPIEGTGYLGRVERIEHVKVGDKLILKADYESQFYEPVAIEVFNFNNETLGYLREDEYALAAVAEILDKVVAYVDSVTPLSARRKNAKYALMDVKLISKKAEEETRKKELPNLIKSKEAALEHAKKEIADCESRKKMLEGTLADLMKMKDKAGGTFSAVAEEYRRKREETQHQINDLEKQIKEVAEACSLEKNAFKAETKKRREPLKELEKSLKDLEATYDEKMEVANACKRKADKKIFFKKKEMQEYELIKSEADSVADHIAEIKRSIESIEEANKDAKEEHKEKMASLIAKEAEYNQQIESLKNNIYLITKDYNNAQEKYDKATNNVKKKDKEIECVKEKISCLKSDIEKLEEELSLMKA